MAYVPFQVDVFGFMGEKRDVRIQAVLHCTQGIAYATVDGSGADLLITGNNVQYETFSPERFFVQKLLQNPLSNQSSWKRVLKVERQNGHQKNYVCLATWCKDGGLEAHINAQISAAAELSALMESAIDMNMIEPEMKAMGKPIPTSADCGYLPDLPDDTLNQFYTEYAPLHAHGHVGQTGLPYIANVYSLMCPDPTSSANIFRFVVPNIDTQMLEYHFYTYDIPSVCFRIFDNFDATGKCNDGLRPGVLFLNGAAAFERYLAYFKNTAV